MGISTLGVSLEIFFDCSFEITSISLSSYFGESIMFMIENGSHFFY